MMGLMKIIKDWSVKRNAVKQLEALTDAQLRDIGICRGDIEYVVDLKRNASALEKATSSVNDNLGILKSA